MELVIGGQKMFGHDSDIVEYRHKICISAPTRYNMEVEMIGNARTGNLAEIDPDVEPLGGDLLLQYVFTDPNGYKKVEEFIVTKAVHLCGVFARRDEQMAVGVRVAIQHHYGERGAV